MAVSAPGRHIILQSMPLQWAAIRLMAAWGVLHRLCNAAGAVSDGEAAPNERQWWTQTPLCLQ